MKSFRVILFFLLLGLFACSTNKISSPKNSTKTLNEAMTEIGSTMVDVYPLILSETPLTNSQNNQILQSSKKLEQLFSQIDHQISKKSTTYQLSYELILEYLQATNDIDNSVDLSFIKQRLVTLSDFCVSCHTQDNKLRTFFSTTKSKNFSSLGAEAEFNFATRNYSEAAKLFEKKLLFSTNLSHSESLKILNRLLVIYIQVLNKPLKAKQVLIRLSQRNSISEDTSDYIDKVITAITKMLAAHGNVPDDVKFKDLQEFAYQYLLDANARQAFTGMTVGEEVERLWLRGVLFRYLNEEPKAEEIPYILYWLALCYRSIGYGYDYTLADFYLKQCVKRYPEHPMAQRCFNDYKDYVEFYFTTPTEPILPMEISQELEDLEIFIKKPKLSR